MKLNKLETTFFKQVLNVELDVPVHGTLTHEGKALEIIVVPTIDDEGYFKLNYFNAPEYHPDPTIQDDGTSHIDFSRDEAFGSHPVLEDAWRKRTAVTLKMKPSMSPFPDFRRRSPSIETRVLYTDLQYRGTLVLHNRQAVLANSPLKSVLFSISSFTDFETPRKQWSSISGISDSDRATLQKVSEKLREGASLAINPAQHFIVLRTGDGWTITLTRDKPLDNETFSHFGTVEKVDGTEYSVSELDHVMEGMRYFFAFTMVKYCFPSVVIGYDRNRNMIFGEAGRFGSDRETPVNWFHHSGEGRWGSILESFFPKFWFKWKVHTDEMKEAIDSYVSSLAMRRAGILRDSVAKSCGGLEIIASLILGNTIRGGAGKKFDKVLKCFGIPHRELNSSDNPVCHQLCLDLNIADNSGARLIADVRNFVIHPLDTDTTSVKLAHNHYLDVDKSYYLYLHDLSQFYFEHLMLRFCGYHTNSYRSLLETEHV